MTIEFWFWFLSILVVIFWALGFTGPEPYRLHFSRGGFLILFILIELLGWDYFNGPVKHTTYEGTRVREVR